jgi:tetratricopeptide (TPR) repeat protein
MRRKNWDKALQHFDALIKIHPKSFLAFRNAGNSFAHLKKFREAAACFERSLKIFPDYHESKIDLGIVCFAGGRPDLAEQLLSEALAKYPTSLRAQAVLDEVKKLKQK